MFEGDDLNMMEEEEQPAEESGNRTFLIVAGVLGGIILLSVACLAGYALLILPRQAAQNNNQQATLVANDVQIATTLTAMEHESLLSQTPPATFTPTVTNTPLIQPAAETSTPTLEATNDPQTATVAAALTQAAQAQMTITFLPSATALPQGGIADEVGAPGLMVMAIALVAVILLARRMRTTSGTR